MIDRREQAEREQATASAMKWREAAAAQLNLPT
jgi:hypothetical protein